MIGATESLDISTTIVKTDLKSKISFNGEI